MSSITAKKAILINFISKYSTVLITLLINSILARLLSPTDYGVVSIVTVFTGFFIMIANIGIGPAIIQNKELENDDIESIFTFTFIIGILVSILFALFSYPISYFYNNKVYIPIGFILSISIFFNVLNMVPNALLLKEKKFHIVAVRNISITLVGGILTIILAFKGFKYYALVLNSVFVSGFTFFVNLINSNIKITIKLNINSLLKIREFASYQFLFNFINYFSRNLDNLLIGKFLGQVSLGYYDKAYKLMLYPVQNLTNVITPVLHPILSDYQNDREIIYYKYMKVVKILSLLGVFTSVFCFFSCHEIITIMFGDSWIESVGAFKILSISILPQMVTGSAGSIFQSLGDTRHLFKTSLINTTITVSCIILGIINGKIETVALGVTISYWLHFIVAYYMLIKVVLKKDILLFIRDFKSIIIICLFMIISYSIIPIKIENVILSVFMKFIIGAITFIISVIITKEIVPFKSKDKINYKIG